MTEVSMLQPIKVGEIYPVISKSAKGDILKGCKLTVTYDGMVCINRKSLKNMGVFSAGYGSGYIDIESGGNPNQTIVEYFFREGFLFPEPFARARNFRGAVENAIIDFVPTSVSAIGKNRHNLYKVDVKYPSTAQSNEFFKSFVSRGKPQIYKISCNEQIVKVVYVFGDNNTAYSNALNFENCMRTMMEYYRQQRAK